MQPVAKHRFLMRRLPQTDKDALLKIMGSLFWDRYKIRAVID